MRRALKAALVVVPVTALVAALTVTDAWPRSPGALAKDAAPPPVSVITEAVAAGQLEKVLKFSCRTAPAEVGRLQAGADPAVVTDLPLTDGQAVQEGTVLAEISARPRIALRGDFPYFRDLGPGITGRDVAQLQEALHRLGYLDAGAVDGEYGAGTGSAVARLWADRGYEAALTSPEALEAIKTAASVVTEAGNARQEASRSGVQGEALKDLQVRSEAAKQAYENLVGSEGVRAAASELVNITGTPAVLDLRGVRLGDALGEQTSPVVLSTAMDVVCEDPGVDPSTLPQTATAQITQGATVCAAVDPLGSLRQPNTPAAAAGQDAEAPNGEGAPAGGGQSEEAPTYTFTPQSPCALTTGTLSVELVLESSPDGSLVVPASAIYETPENGTIVRVSRGSTVDAVPVVPGITVEGQVTVTSPGGDLAEGDRVVVGSP